MPSSREINEARQHGDVARELLEQALVTGATASRATPSLPAAPFVMILGAANLFAAAHPHQAAPTLQAATTFDSHISAIAKATTNQLAPNLGPPAPHVRTQGLANIFASTFPDQAAPTFQAAPTVDSRTGHQSNALTNANATTDQPSLNPGIIITDAHAQQQAPTVMGASSTTHTSQCGRSGRGGRDGGGRGGRGARDGRGRSGRGARDACHGAQSGRRSTARTNQPPTDAALRVRAILNNRIAPSARKAYTDYNIRFILWLYDNGHHDIISPMLLDILHKAHVQDLEHLTTRNTPSKQRNFMCAAI
jgi:hypothetical protein